MKFNPEEHLIRPRNSVRERELAETLRRQPEPIRFEFIWEYLHRDSYVGLVLANACLRERLYFERVLRLGLELADASSIQFWLEAVVPRIGVRRVVSLLEEHLRMNAVAVEKALYWLPRFVRPGDEKLLAAIDDLRGRLRGMGLLREPPTDLAKK